MEAPLTKITSPDDAKYLPAGHYQNCSVAAVILASFRTLHVHKKSVAISSLRALCISRKICTADPRVSPPNDVRVGGTNGSDALKTAQLTQ